MDIVIFDKDCVNAIATVHPTGVDININKVIQIIFDQKLELHNFISELILIDQDFEYKFGRILIKLQSIKRLSFIIREKDPNKKWWDQK